jgi:hypothetical protein
MDAPLPDSQIAIVRQVLQRLRDGEHPFLTLEQLDGFRRSLVRVHQPSPACRWCAHGDVPMWCVSDVVVCRRGVVPMWRFCLELYFGRRPRSCIAIGSGWYYLPPAPFIRPLGRCHFRATHRNVPDLARAPIRTPPLQLIRPDRQHSGTESSSSEIVTARALIAQQKTVPRVYYGSIALCHSDNLHRGLMISDQKDHR